MLILMTDPNFGWPQYTNSRATRQRANKLHVIGSFLEKLVVIKLAYNLFVYYGTHTSFIAFTIVEVERN